MALSLSQFSLLSPFSQKLHPPNITTSHTYKFTPIFTHQTPIKFTHQKHTLLIPKATQQENGNNNSEITETPENEQQIVNSDDDDDDDSNVLSSATTELGEQIKNAMKEKREKEKDSTTDFWSGVGEEIREIEWPAFNKVLGTTGVVLGVILGSSVVLLTVNAVLAELSDRVFAGKGLQDFFIS